ncbi:hypothetical protein B0H19DRAFT_1254349 [Mycena capillaripes]|nr:hypothetical protein B0H19DRAFT_1254349 [Mycena capillaripes]
MSDYDGKDWPLRVTKYWDDDQQEVVYSAKLREEPIELRKILGYYEWVFNAYEEEDKEVEPGSHGHLTLEVDKTKIETSKTKKGKGGSVKDVDPAHAAWTFDHQSIVEEPEEDKNPWDDNDFCCSRFLISVVDVTDDNGHPFIQFTHSPGMHEMDVTYIGKKQKKPRKSSLKGLTDGERQRLGMFVDEEEIKRVALELKKASGSAESTASDDGNDVEKRGTDDADKGLTPRKRKAEDGLPDEEVPPCKK